MNLLFASSTSAKESDLIMKNKIFKHIPMVLLCACAPTVAPSACSQPDTFLGDGGAVNFSTVVDYQEDDLFAAELRVGVGLPFPVGLFDADDGDDTTIEAEALDLSLNVVAQNAGTAQTLPFGPAQFMLFFESPDIYELQAVDQNNVVVDSLTINAVVVDHVRLAAGVQITTQGEECDTSVSIFPLDPNDSAERILSEQTLHTNQSIDVAFIAADINDAPVMGILNIQGDSDLVQVTAFPFGDGVPANSFSFRPIAESNGTVTASFSIEGFTPQNLQFQAVQEEEIPVCQ
jgi:hypothetical protein